MSLRIGPVDVGRSYWRGQSILVEFKAIMRFDLACRKGIRPNLIGPEFYFHVEIGNLTMNDLVVQDYKGLQACNWCLGHPCLPDSACVCCASGIPLCGNERLGTPSDIDFEGNTNI